MQNRVDICTCFAFAVLSNLNVRQICWPLYPTQSSSYVDLITLNNLSFSCDMQLALFCLYAQQCLSLLSVGGANFHTLSKSCSLDRISLKKIESIFQLSSF